MPHVTAVLLVHVPVVLPAGIVHVPVLLTLQQSTAFALPHVDRAEHGAIPSVGQPSLRSALRRWTAQLWCCPWFDAPLQGHAASIAAATHVASVEHFTLALLVHVPLLQVSG